MNGSTDTATTQAIIEWYLKEKHDGTVHAMSWETVSDGSLRLPLYRGEEPSVRLFAKVALQGYMLKGQEQRFQETLRCIVEAHKYKSHMQCCLACADHFVGSKDRERGLK